MAEPTFGVIADDFTGATDIGAMLVRGGMKVVLTIGPPVADFDFGDADAVVVALKTRSIPAPLAVTQSLSALKALRQVGVSRVQFKYCSTFDSTPDGNIGPVSDALAAEMGSDLVVHIPALPINGRTVFKGHLFVGNALLSESGMENHPLNPMTDANLLRCLGAQVKGDVTLIDHATLATGADHVRAALAESGGASHVIGDAIDEADLRVWADVLQDAVFFAGGAGLATPLAQLHSDSKGGVPAQPGDFGTALEGHTLILSGSCSKATLGQIEAFRKAGGAIRQIDPIAIEAGEVTVEAFAKWAGETLTDKPVLIHGSASPADVLRAQTELGEARAGEVIEGALSKLAAMLAPQPHVARIIVAGGETSGAVVSRLQIAALRIGSEIDPGVPWTLALDATGTPLIPIALKSGNFGGEDFFVRASLEDSL
jgi:uncharacterized protein YgbK (DUF1537 family)